VNSNIEDSEPQPVESDSNEVKSNDVPVYQGTDFSPYPVTKPVDNSYAIAALACGLVSILVSWSGFIVVLIGLLAVVFGILALRNKQQETMSWWGIGTGAVGVTLALLMGFWMYGTLGGFFGDVSEDTESHTSGYGYSGFEVGGYNVTKDPSSLYTYKTGLTEEAITDVWMSVVAPTGSRVTYMSPSGADEVDVVDESGVWSLNFESFGATPSLRVEAENKKADSIVNCEMTINGALAYSEQQLDVASCVFTEKD